MSTAANSRNFNSVERIGLAHAADRVGATASMLCAVHCAALPFVLALLPALGLGFLGSHVFERGFIAFASVFASIALLQGYRRHRDARALLLLVPGVVLLWIGGFAFDAGSTPWTHALLVALGGSCVAFAHLTNLRLSRHHAQGNCRCPSTIQDPAIV